MDNEKWLIWGDIAKNQLKKLADYYRGSFSGDAFERAAQAIAELPAVDAVEVVRCKDCIYYIETVGKDSGKPCGYGSCGCTCQIITGIIYDEDFCSYGERKDNGSKQQG